MGKITVKHYLNTRVSPLDIFDGNLYYPIYVQITYNRKTTQIKSFTKIYATKIGYNNYLVNIFDANDFLSCGFRFGNINVVNISLSNELTNIELGMRYTINVNFDLSKDKRYISSILSILLSNIGELLREHFRHWIMAEYCEEQIDLQLYFAFNPKNTLFKNIEIIKKYTKIDLSEFIRKRDFELSQDIDTFTEIVNDCKFINLVNMDYISIVNKDRNIKNKDYFIEYLNHIRDTVIDDCRCF